MLRIDISNEQSSLPIDLPIWRRWLRELLTAEGVRSGEISVAVIHDAQMHELNRKHLDHDYPTDVLSFVWERADARLDGEIIVSADTAIDRCREFGWSPWQELSLYVIHGALHLVGFRDKSAADQARMRAREQHYLQRFQLAECPLSPGPDGAVGAPRPPSPNCGERPMKEGA